MEIKIENLNRPLGLDEINPRVSYIVKPEEKNSFQVGYEINVKRGCRVLYESGHVKSSQTVNIELRGLPLKAYTEYTVEVASEDNTGRTICAETVFETGKLNEEMKGSFIGANFDTKVNLTANKEDCFERPIVFQRKFEYRCVPVKARLYVSSIGIHYCRINGEIVGDCFFAPGWTSHKKHLQYYTYDVAKYLKNGENTIEITVSNGWYNRKIEWAEISGQSDYSNNLAVIAYLAVTNEDGEMNEIVTDEKWRYKFNNISLASIFDGEHCCAYETHLTDWPVRILDYDKSVLRGTVSEPVRIIKHLPVQDIFTTPKGETVLDVGQNVVGFPLLKITGKKDACVYMQFAEVLDNDGNFYNANYRSAKSELKYILKDGYQEYHPRTTFYGFRYIRVNEYPGIVSKDNFEICILHSDMECTGYFECDNPLLNRLHNNILWSMRGNYLDIPTDCPQRDERLGWTADAHAFLSTAGYLYNVNAFMKKWLIDLRLDQGKKGAVPVIVPNINISDAYEIREDTVNYSSGWSDAAAVCPYTVYQYYDDKRLLGEQLESMRKWCDFLYKQFMTPKGINTEHHFGDWVALDAQEGDYIGATPLDFIAHAFMLYSIKLTIQAERVLEDPEGAERYEMMYDTTKKMFTDKYCTEEGVVNVPTQTAKILALKFDLVKNKPLQAKYLAEQIIEDDYRLIVGFLGIPYILHVLSENGYKDIAYRMLLRREYPSWLYQVDKGATTIWEHLDGIKEDGSFWSADMNSFNHYAYGSIGSFLYEYLGGIRLNPKYPGFKKFIVRPEPCEAVNSVKMSFKSVYGWIKVKWLRSEGIFKLEVTVPFNTSATIVMPGGDNYKVESGSYSFSEKI